MKNMMKTKKSLTTVFSLGVGIPLVFYSILVFSLYSLEVERKKQLENRVVEQATPVTQMISSLSPVVANKYQALKHKF